MWSGPYNPTGAYKFPAHYGDGTPIHDSDFTNADWPDTGNYGQRWIYGELEINEMVPPSHSCMSTKLPPNNVVRTKLLGAYKDYANTLLDKPVVCEGNSLVSKKVGY